MARSMLLPALLAACLVAVVRGQPGCVKYPDDYGNYEITSCPLGASAATPIVLTNASTFVPTSYDDGYSPLITIPFSVWIYGMPWEDMYIGTNGVLMFGPTPISSTTTTLPVTFNAEDAVPIVAPHWADLYWDVAAGCNITYSTQGPVGSRLFIIRWHRMQWWSTRGSYPDTTLSFDVIFKENVRDVIIVNYYNYSNNPASSTISTTVGMQSYDAGGSAAVIFNSNSTWSAIQSTLNGRSFNYTYIGQDLPELTCGGLGYDLSGIQSADLTFTEPNGNQWFYHPCGEVTNTVCKSSPFTEHSMVCQLPTGATRPLDIAIYGPRSTYYQFPPGSTNGLTVFFQDGQYCTELSAERFTTINYVCEATATTPRIHNASTPSPCIHVIEVRTNLVCGPGSRGGSQEGEYRASTLGQCVSVPGNSYNARICPRPSDELEPIVLTNPINVPNLGNAESSIVSPSISLGFPFNFYGQDFGSVTIALNGALYFATPYAYQLTAAPSFGQGTNTDYFPVIAAFNTYLSAQSLPGMPQDINITYSRQSQQSGRRQFIVRYDNLKYQSYRGLFDMRVSFDVILTEGRPASEVEIRYYEVSGNPNVITTVGMHGDADINMYTSYVNYAPLTSSLAGQMQGATLTFNYTGRYRGDACSYRGTNFSQALNGDLTFTSGTNTFYINPCGTVSSNALCVASAPRSSVCQISSGNAYELATFNPSSIIWTTSPAPLLGLRSTLRDGSYCSVVNAPRTTIIDWLCSKTTTTTYVASVSESPTCTYNIQLYTPLACLADNVCQNVTTDSYTSSWCPDLSPAPLMNNATAVMPSQDDAFARIKLPFLFYIYGIPYDYAFISTNGVLSFGTNGITTIGDDFPLESADMDALPIVAGWWTDLDNKGQSSITYQTITVNGEDVFLVRYSTVDYYGSTPPSPEVAVSFDIQLFQGLSGQVKVRYYGVAAPPTAKTVTTGVMSSDDLSNTLWYEAMSITPALADAYTNTTAIYRYVGPDVWNQGCGALGYNLSTLAGQDLFFNDTTGRILWSLRVCGYVSNTVCQSQTWTSRSMICQAYYNAAGEFSGNQYSVTTWNPNVQFWQYGPGNTGVQLIMQDGGWCGAIGAQRTGLINFVCDPTATTPRFTNIAEPFTCVYIANVSTNLVCGPGERGNIPPIPPPPVSTLSECVNYPGSEYSGTLCPRASTDPLNVPINQTNPVRVLTQDNAVQMISIPFPFILYDVPMDRFYLSSNGLLEFGYGSTLAPSAINARFPDMGFGGDNNYYPLIAAFFTDLINVQTQAFENYNGYIAYSIEGVAPNRQLVLRFHKVNYFTTRNSLFHDLEVTFDVVLTEGNPGLVEVRYYDIEANPLQQTLIGMHGYGTSYLAISNALPVSTLLAGQLSGATLRLRWNGANAMDLCDGIPGSYNFSTLASADLNLTRNGYTFYFRPCGTVQAAQCRNNYGTSHATVCQAAGTTTYALATDNPTATVYTFPDDNIVRATMANGEYCGGLGARVTTVDFICDQRASSPIFWDVSEPSPCRYQLKVNTSLACSAPANCTAFPGTLYNAQLCNATGAYRQPRIMTNPVAVLNDTYTRDDSYAQVDIPFEAYVYGQPWSRVWINVNGFIAFGATGASFLGASIPLGVNYQDSLPIVAVYLDDLYNQNSNDTSFIGYSTEGNAPNRAFIIRWQDINYYATRPGGSEDVGDQLLSFDVILYEDIKNRVDVVYHKIGNYEYSDPTIGIQGADGMSYTVVNNFQYLSTRGISLPRTSLRYFYTGVDYSVNRTCGGLGYNFVPIMGGDLVYTQGTDTVYYNPCNIVLNAACANVPATERSMACLVTTSGTVTTNRNLAVYNPLPAVWTYLDNGVQMYMPTGPYCYTTQLPGISFTNFVCDLTATSPRISNISIEQAGCVSFITINTIFACGGGNRNQNQTSTRPPLSTLQSCYNVTGSSYNARVCPRYENDPYYYPQNMTNPTRILVNADDSTVSIPIGFPFDFYGVPDFTRINISSNGLLQLGEGSDPTGNPNYLSSTTSTYNNWPLISAFWSNLINQQSDNSVTYPGYIQYSHEGTSPNRQLIVRFNLVDYYNYRYYPSITGVSFDVVLMEDDGIEFRYYRIDANPTTYATIGLRADDYASTAYTAIGNYVPITATFANQLQGSTTRFAYTGRTPNEACGAFGYSVLPISGTEVVYTASNNRTYYHKPCGIVASSICQSNPITAHATICEAAGTSPLATVTTFNPSSIRWAQLANGISATSQDGTYCGTPLFAPRRSTINYICDAAATVPAITNVTVVNSCTYFFTINTNAVCQIYVPPSSSSAAPRPSSSSSSAANQARSSSSSSVATPSQPSSSSSSSSSSTNGPQPRPSSSSSSSGVIPTRSSSSSTASSPQQSSSSSSSSSEAAVVMSSSSSSSSDGAVPVPDSSSSSSLNSGAVAGIVIGVIAGSLILCAMVFFLCVAARRGKDNSAGGAGKYQGGAEHSQLPKSGASSAEPSQLHQYEDDGELHTSDAEVEMQNI